MRINDYLFSEDDIKNRRLRAVVPVDILSDEDHRIFQILSENNASIIVALSKLIPYYDMTSGVKVAAMKDLIDACLAPIDPDFAPNEWGVDSVTNALAVVEDAKEFMIQFLKYAELRKRITNRWKNRKDRKMK